MTSAALISPLCKAVMISTLAHQTQDALHLASIPYFLLFRLFLLLDCQPGGGNAEYMETEGTSTSTS